MKKVTLLIPFLFLLILVNCKQGSKLPENYQDEVCTELSEITDKLFETWVNEDLETHISYFDKDFVNRYGAGPALNFEESKQAFKSLFDNYSIEAQLERREECFADHNFAYQVVLFEQTWISNDKQDTVHSGKVRLQYVFKKQEDGNWKVFRYLGQHPTTDVN